MFCIISHDKNLIKTLDKDNINLTLALDELNSDDSAQLISSITSFTDNDIELLTDRANGNPLFLEELSKNKGDGQEELPETVNDVIMAKLDRLDNGKNILQYASVIGDTFDTKLLKQLVHGIRGADG